MGCSTAARSSAGPVDWITSTWLAAAAPAAERLRSSSNTISHSGWPASDAKIALTSPRDMFVPCLNEKTARASPIAGANGFEHSTSRSAYTPPYLCAAK